MLSFALGAALLSILLSGATYLLTRRNLLDQRESSSIAQVARDAELMGVQITPEAMTSDELSDSLQSVVSRSGSHPVIEVIDSNDRPTTAATSTQYGIDAIPTRLRTLVKEGTPSVMRVDVNGEPTLMIGVPLEQVNAQYYEIISLQDIADTLRALTNVLLITMAGTTDRKSVV